MPLTTFSSSVLCLYQQADLGPYLGYILNIVVKVKCMCPPKLVTLKCDEQACAAHDEVTLPHVGTFARLRFPAVLPF